MPVKNKLHGCLEPTENEIKRAICNLLSCYPNRCIFTLTPNVQASRVMRSKFMLRGLPDISGIWDKQPLYIEVKTPKGIVSKEQEWFLSKVTQLHGAIAFVARSPEDVIRKLNLQTGE